MGTIYQCLKRDNRYTPPMMTVVHEAKSSSEAVRWLENNGGGIFRNLLHNFDCSVAAKGPTHENQNRRPDRTRP